MLLRISTRDGKEVLLWLTRRCVRQMWPILVGMAQSTPRISLQSDAEARAALLGFEHEQALREADFSRPYEETARERPFGEEPMLVAWIRGGKAADGNHVLSLGAASKPGIDISLDDTLLHSFCRLLQNEAASAEWDLALSLPRPLPPDPERAARTIN